MPDGFVCQAGLVSPDDDFSFTYPMPPERPFCLAGLVALSLSAAIFPGKSFYFNGSEVFLSWRAFCPNGPFAFALAGLCPGRPFCHVPHNRHFSSGLARCWNLAACGLCARESWALLPWRAFAVPFRALALASLSSGRLLPWPLFLPW